jgi:hypothetical protein
VSYTTDIGRNLRNNYQSYSQDLSSHPLLDGLDLKLGQLIAAEVQPTWSASMTSLVLGCGRTALGKRAAFAASGH